MTITVTLVGPGLQKAYFTAYFVLFPACGCASERWHRSRCPQLNFPASLFVPALLSNCLAFFFATKKKTRRPCETFLPLQYPDPRELADGSRPKRSLWDSRNDQHHIQENPTSFDND
jgi:hypothetical protein